MSSQGNSSDEGGLGIGSVGRGRGSFNNSRGSDKLPNLKNSGQFSSEEEKRTGKVYASTPKYVQKQQFRVKTRSQNEEEI